MQPGVRECGAGGQRGRRDGHDQGFRPGAHPGGARATRRRSRTRGSSPAIRHARCARSTTEWCEQVSEWRSQASRGTPLSEAQLASLRLQVGIRELEHLGLTGGRSGLDETARAELEAEALAELLARADRLLAGRRRRLEFLARLAESGGPLEDVLIEELAEDWGRELTAAVRAGHPGSWGPATTVITQDPRAALPVLPSSPTTRARPGLRRWT